MSYNKHAFVKTPQIDKLAADGVYFARHYSQATPSGPSRASLHTGLYAFNHRSVTNGTPLDSRHKTLAQIARLHGLDPVLFGHTDASLDPRTTSRNDRRLHTYEGLAAGFREGLFLTESSEPWLDHLKDQGYGQLTVDELYSEPFGQPARYCAEDSETAFLTDTFLHYLNRQPKPPWFAHLSYLRPHPPWVAAEPYHSLLNRAGLASANRLPTIIDQAQTHPWLQNKLAQPFEGWLGHALDRPSALSADKIAEMQAIYYGLIIELDHHIGRIIRRLDHIGVLDQTFIILTSDHGEMLGDAWLTGKSGFYPQAFHVPLIVRHPKQRQTAGALVDHFTGHIDIMPTILSALDIPIPKQCDGDDLSEFLTGAPP